MKPYSLALFAILIFGLFFVFPISATTVSGDITGLNYSQISYFNLGFTPGSGKLYQQWYVNSIEFNTNLKSFVIFDNYLINSYDAGASAGESTSFTLRTTSLNGPIIATGTMGYQRLWNAAVPPVEQMGYVWFVFDNGWNTTGLSGDRTDIWCNYSASAVRNVTRQGSATSRVPPYDGYIEIYTNPAASYLETYETVMATHYVANGPAGIGISGNATKTPGTTSRVFIINPVNGSTLTSEGTQTNTLFNFNVPNAAGAGIIIAAQDAKGNFYNTSTLLTGGGIPTPTTTTPTAGPTTPEPGSWTNITFTTKYGVNNTAIPNVFTKLYMYHEGGPTGDDDWSQAVDGYTDSNGQITFSEVHLPGWDFRVEFTKPGLYQLDFWVTPSQYSYSLPVYMYVQPANSEIPGFPITFNLTVQVKNANTYAAIPSAWVTVGDDISGTNYVGQSTNATGYVVFPGIPNTANINGVISKVGYVPLTYWVTSGALLDGDTAITKYLYLSTSTVTPTITPVPQEGVTLTANPNSVAPGQSTTLTTTCANVTACTGAGGMRVVTYSEKYPDPSWDTHLIRAYKWNATRGYYDYRNNSVDPWIITGTMNGLTATGTPTISGTNTYYVNIMRTDYYSIGTANVGVLVTGAVSGNLIMKLAAQDQTTGGHLSNYQMNLTNANTGSTTEYGNIPYDKDVLLPRGQDYTVMCSKPGYLGGSSDFTVPTNPNIENGHMGTFVNCPLYPTGSISAGNTTVTVKVFDSENYVPLSGVTVQMSAPIIYSDSPKYTGGDGSGVFFILGQNQPYTVTASKTGYCAVTETGNTSTLNTKNVYLNLKYGSCLGPTPTHTPTPGPTGTGVIVTPTTFQPGNATSFWTPWINVFTMMGARTGEINMLLAGLIIVLCMAAGAGMAGVLGAEVLMGFGAIFCVAIGLIPIWVVLAIIILGFLFYGLKIGR